MTVFHAASLARALAEMEERLEAQHPGLDLRLEPSGSQVAARKVSELNRLADLVLAADWRIIDQLLLPDHADWLIQFATNEVVLAHGEHSPYTEDITADNWPKLLVRPDVRLGRADENTAPLGFHTLLLWELAQQHYGVQAVGPNLSERLQARCSAERVTPDIAELVSLLEAKVIDYGFVFRSIAEEHNLKVTRLPAEYNLGSNSMAQTYARAQVPVTMKPGKPPTMIGGAPIVYGLTIPRRAPNRRDAELVTLYLLGSAGKRILGRSGFTPLTPPLCPNPERLPPTISSGLEATQGP